MDSFKICVRGNCQNLVMNWIWEVVERGESMLKMIGFWLEHLHERRWGKVEEEQICGIRLSVWVLGPLDLRSL